MIVVFWQFPTLAMTPEMTETQTVTLPLDPNIQKVLDEFQARIAKDMQSLTVRLIMQLLEDPVRQGQVIEEMIMDPTTRAQLIDEFTKEPDTHLTLPYRLLLIAERRRETVFADPNSTNVEKNAAANAVGAAIEAVRKHNDIVHPARKL